MSALMPKRNRKPVRGWKRYFRFRKFAKEDDGATTVEFAFVVVPFLLFSATIFETTINYFAQQTLHHGVAEVGRLIKTNQVTGVTHTEAEFRALLCARPVLSFFKCEDFMIDVREVNQFQDLGTPRLQSGHVDTTDFQFNPGGAVSVNVMRIYYEFPLFLAFAALSDHDNVSKGSRTLMSSQAFMIEPQ